MDEGLKRLKRVKLFAYISLAALGIIFLLATIGSAYAGTVTIISPVTAKKKINALPSVFKKRVSLIGSNLSLQTAFGMLTRITNIPFIVMHSADIKSTPAGYYFIHKPLYKILNALIIDNGYAYKYKRNEIYIYGLVSKTFHLPIINNLQYSFSAGTGMSGSSVTPSSGTGSGSISTLGTASATGAASSGASNPVSSSSMGTSNGSNPGGTIGGSMVLGKTDLYYIKKTLKMLISKQGKFQINPVLGLVYVTDRPGRVRKIGNFIHKVSKNMVRAVVLKVKVLDVELNGSNQFGIDWNAVFTEAFKSNPAALNTVTIGANLASGAGITAGAPSVQFANAAGTNTALLTALSSQGKVNVISTPTLMVLNGETRTIADSGISSYVQSIMTTTSGLTSSSTYPVISQVQTGLSISFTPRINPKTGIVTVTVNFLDNDITGYNNFSVGGNSFSNPIIDSKTLTDTIRVLNNHTLIMGGILTASNSKQNYGIPLLSSIPILGSLFTGINNTNSKSDLVIMITPKIVKF